MNLIELNGIWVHRAQEGPMHPGHRTGPLCPMFLTNLEEPCSVNYIKPQGFTICLSLQCFSLTGTNWKFVCLQKNK